MSSRFHLSLAIMFTQCRNEHKITHKQLKLTYQVLLALLLLFSYYNYLVLVIIFRFYIEHPQLNIKKIEKQLLLKDHIRFATAIHQYKHNIMLISGTLIFLTFNK